MATGAEGHTERTFIMLKPEATQRGLVAELIRRFEVKGFKLLAMKFQVVGRQVFGGRRVRVVGVMCGV